jgi:hypothetical protein
MRRTWRTVVLAGLLVAVYGPAIGCGNSTTQSTPHTAGDGGQTRPRPTDQKEKGGRKTPPRLDD